MAVHSFAALHSPHTFYALQHKVDALINRLRQHQWQTYTLKVELSIAVCVKNADDTRDQRVILQFRQNCFELCHTDSTGVVEVKFLKTFAQSLYLFRRN